MRELHVPPPKSGPDPKVTRDGSGLSLRRLLLRARDPHRQALRSMRRAPDSPLSPVRALVTLRKAKRAFLCPESSVSCAMYLGLH